MAKDVGLALLVAGFALATAPSGVEGGAMCDSCPAHANASDALGEDHLHPEGGSPEKGGAADSCPCHQDPQCCCGQGVTLFPSEDRESADSVVVGRVAIPADRVHPDPSLRLTFHVPIA